MKTTRNFVLAAVCAALSACGGGEDQSQVAPPAPVATPSPISAPAPVAAPPAQPTPAPAPQPAPTPQPAPKPQKPVLIDVYGDDAMSGMTSMMGRAQQSETDQSQSLLQAMLNGTAVTIANHATGGGSSSLKNEMLGMDGNGAPFAERIKTSAASIVIDNHAINDALGGETLADYRQYLAQWIAAVRAAGKTPVLEEPGPVCDGDHPQLAAYVDAMNDAAGQFNVLVVKQFDYIQTLPNWQSHMSACLYPDEWMLQVKGQRLAQALAPLAKNTIGDQ